MEVERNSRIFTMVRKARWGSYLTRGSDGGWGEEGMTRGSKGRWG